MSRMYDNFCETVDSIYIAINESGLSEGLFKQLHKEQGADTVAYVVKQQFVTLPIFFNEALDHVTKEITNE
jgi:hypothetical protein